MNDFNTISNKLLSEDFLDYAKSRLSLSNLDLKSILTTSIEEAKWGETIIANYNLKNMRVLEIGSGASILSAYIKLKGIEITSLEPGAQVFDFYRNLSKIIHQYLGLDSFKHLSIPIESLNREEHGEFDFIFSINVLEHVKDVNQCLTILTSLLSPNGIMVHICPNYLFPYEPHLGILLIPFFPKLTRFITSRNNKNIWDSINYITCKDVIKSAKKNNCKLNFRKQLIYNSLIRFEKDSEFKKRQTGTLLKVYKILKSTHLLNAIKYIPYQISTPMVFEWKK